MPRILGPSTEQPGLILVETDDGRVVSMTPDAAQALVSGAPSGLSAAGPASAMGDSRATPNADLAALVAAPMAQAQPAMYAQGPAQGQPGTATDAVLPPEDQIIFRQPSPEVAALQNEQLGFRTVEQPAPPAAPGGPPPPNVFQSPFQPWAASAPPTREEQGDSPVQVGQGDFATSRGLGIDPASGAVVQLERLPEARRGRGAGALGGLQAQTTVRGDPIAADAMLRGDTAAEIEAGRARTEAEQPFLDEAAREAEARDAEEFRQRKLMEDRHQEIVRRVEDTSRNVERAIEAVQNYRVDPDRFFRNRGAASGFAAALGVAAGAMSSAMLGPGTPNVAYQIVQSAIERDIQAQMEDAQNLRAGAQGQLSLFSALNSAYNDERAAAQAMRAIRLADAENRLRTIAMRMQSSTATQAFQQMAAQMQAERDRYRIEAHQRGLETHLAGEGIFAQAAIQAGVDVNTMLNENRVRMEALLGAQEARRQEDATRRAAGAGTEVDVATGQRRPAVVDPGSPLAPQPVQPPAEDPMAAVDDQAMLAEIGGGEQPAEQTEDDFGVDTALRSFDAAQAPARPRRRGGAQRRPGRAASPRGWSREAMEAAGGSAAPGREGGLRVYRVDPTTQRPSTSRPLSQQELNEGLRNRTIWVSPIPGPNNEQVLVEAPGFRMGDVAARQDVEALQLGGARRVELGEGATAVITDADTFNDPSIRTRRVDVMDKIQAIRSIIEDLTRLRDLVRNPDITDLRAIQAEAEAIEASARGEINAFFEANTIQQWDLENLRTSLGEPLSLSSQIRDRETYYNEFVNRLIRRAERHGRSIGIGRLEGFRQPGVPAMRARGGQVATDLGEQQINLPDPGDYD